jgi:hypothetical protein
MLHAKVTHADALRMALLVQTLQRLPELLAPRRTRAGAVNKEEIHVSPGAADLLHAVQQLLVGRIGRTGGAEDLGGDEDLIAG